jgi:hypothetical protein
MNAPSTSNAETSSSVARTPQVPQAATMNIHSANTTNNNLNTFQVPYSAPSIDPSVQLDNTSLNFFHDFDMSAYNNFPSNFNIGFPPQKDIITYQPASDTGSVQSRNMSSPYNINSVGTNAGPSPNSIEQSADAALRQLMHQVASTPIVPPTTQTKANLHMSLPPSRAGSATPEDDDILGPEKINAPLESMSNMAGLVEAAVERAREERTNPLAKRQNEVSDRPVKKARFGDDPVSGKKMKMKTTHVHAYPDVVDEGILGEVEAKELMAMWVIRRDSR